MPYRKEQFVNGRIYHTIIRALDDGLLFKNTDDHYRGIFSIYEFNNAKRVEIRDRRRARMKLKEETKKVAQQFNKVRGQRVSADLLTDSRDKLVEVMAFCLMPNHIHLLIRQLKEDGITKFMRKLGAGYGRYFNKKYQRKGYVFQNRFTAVQIKSDEQLKTVWAYTHANPVSLIEPKWKERRIKNFKKVAKFSKNYKWSSCLDYLGTANFPSITEREFIIKLMGGQSRCKEFLEDYIRYKGRVREFPELTLE